MWRQSQGKVDAFVMGSGTGGTIAGVSRYLKERKPTCEVVLVDPQGSSLYNKVAHGVAYATEQSESRLRKHRYDTIVEGVGIDRLTANFWWVGALRTEWPCTSWLDTDAMRCAAKPLWTKPTASRTLKLCKCQGGCCAKKVRSLSAPCTCVAHRT